MRVRLRGVAQGLQVLLLTCTLWILGGRSAGASTADFAFRELHHTAWGPRDGLVGRGVALAQTRDGFLWIGTSDGLYRFDGVLFEKYQPFQGSLPVGAVRSLLASDDGSLWVGFSDSRISHLEKGIVTNYGSKDGIPVGGVRFMVPDGNGGFFSSATGGIIHFNGKQFERVRQNWSLPLAAADCALLDHSGTLWITSEGNTFYLLRGQHNFQDTGLHTGRVTALLEDRERIGLIAEYSNEDKLFWVPRPATNPVELPYSSYSQYAMIDRGGAAWLGQEAGGLYRARTSDLLQLAFSSEFHRGIESQTTVNGLSSDVSITLLEDREGNVWSLTDRGLDRFRLANAVNVQIPAGYYTMTLAVGPDHEIWAEPWETTKGIPGTWFRLRDGHTADRSFNRMAFAVPADGDKLYFSSQDRDLTVHGKPDGTMWCWSKAGFQKIPRPPGLDTFRITSMAVDALQRVWIQVSAGGEWIYDPSGTWERRDQPVLDRNHPKFFASREAKRLMYLLYPTGLLVAENDSVHPLVSSIPSGVRLQELAVFNGKVFVATDHGLYVVRDDHLDLLELEMTGPASDVVQMISSEKSGLWMVTGRNIVHVGTQQISQLLSAPGIKRVKPEIFDLLSDLPEPLNSQPGEAVEGPDGVMWFASLSQVVRIDPRNIWHNPLPPSVVISQVSLGDRSLDPLREFKILPGRSELRFTYTATSLSVAEKVRFRYRIEGLNENWIDAGSRREAILLGLPPGKYRFHVIASNNDGVWNMEGTSIPFEILPHFYQTWWFEGLIATVVLLLLSFVLILRMRKISDAIRLHAAARESERQHIARDLHDDFFPSLYGIFLSVGSVARTLPQDGSAKGKLETVLDSADEVMKHGRELVLQLRRQPESETDFVAALVEFGRKQEDLYGIVFYHSVKGTREPITTHAQQQLVAIGREALGNAFRHSQAQKITLDIEFTERHITLQVMDDGIGIPSSMIEDGRDGHIGLHTMRERAAAIHASIRIQQNLGGGTVVTVQVAPKSVRRN